MATNIKKILFRNIPKRNVVLISIKKSYGGKAILKISYLK